MIDRTSTNLKLQPLQRCLLLREGPQPLACTPTPVQAELSHRDPAELDHIAAVAPARRRLPTANETLVDVPSLCARGVPASIPRLETEVSSSGISIKARSLPLVHVQPECG